MAEDDSKWPAGDHSLVPDDYAHALGVFTVYYNTTETLLHMLVQVLLKNKRAVTELINHHLHNSARLDLLRQLAAELSADESDRVLHAVNCFDICSENRNILMHARITRRRKDGVGPIGEHLAQKRSSKPGVDVHFELPLSKLRQVADQTEETLRYLIALVEYLIFRRESEAGQWKREPSSLPDKPPRPDKLSLSPPPSDPSIY